MASNFEAQVSARVAAYKKRMEATFRASAQDLAEEATKPVAKGGNMRVKTGFLRASLMASTSALPLIKTGNRPPATAADNSFQPDESQITLTIAKAQLGETIYLGFTADYAAPREYKDGFVRLAAQNWQEIAKRNALRAIKAFP